MNRDNDAINRLRNNQNRIQTTGNLTNDEQAFVNNPDMVNKYEEIEEGASGIAEGGATTSKKGLIGLGFLGKLKKIKFFIIGGLISIFSHCSAFMIIPGLFEPPIRTLRATIPENESHIFR